MSSYVKIKTPDGTCDAYVACQRNEAYPAVILYMDAFGLRPYLREMADKLASNGYYVLVPNMFYRISPAPIPDLNFPLKMEQMEEARKVLMPLFTKFSQEKAIDDAGAFLEFLGSQKQARKGKVACTGYCMGGTLALRTAARYPDRIAAVGCFHAGRLASDEPDSPHLLLKEIKAEIYCGHADNDQSLPKEMIERFQKAAEEAKVKFKAEIYEGAPHGYTMADLPMYNKTGLDRHWKNLLDLLKRNLH